MEKKKKYMNPKKKTRPSDKESIEDLKKKIQHQKDALNKIIKSYSNNKE
jgi:CHASE3 domain sensor protein